MSRKTITADKLNELMAASAKLSSNIAAFINVNQSVLPPEVVSMLAECHDRVLKVLHAIEPMPGGIAALLIAEPEVEN